MDHPFQQREAPSSGAAPSNLLITPVLTPQPQVDTANNLRDAQDKVQERRRQFGENIDGVANALFQGKFPTPMLLSTNEVLNEIFFIYQAFSQVRRSQVVTSQALRQVVQEQSQANLQEIVAALGEGSLLLYNPVNTIQVHGKRLKRLSKSGPSRLQRFIYKTMGYWAIISIIVAGLASMAAAILTFEHIQSRFKMAINLGAGFLVGAAVFAMLPTLQIFFPNGKAWRELRTTRSHVNNLRKAINGLVVVLKQLQTFWDDEYLVMRAATHVRSTVNAEDILALADRVDEDSRETSELLKTIRGRFSVCPPEPRKPLPAQATSEGGNSAGIALRRSFLSMRDNISLLWSGEPPAGTHRH